MENFGPTSHTFYSQRLQLRYVDWGNHSAPPLLLVHGGKDHCRSWDWVARQLAKDWHVIAPDLRGHGDSAWSVDGNYSMQAYLYDLSQLIHQLKLAPVTIVAHSLGGMISLRYAGLYPENVKQIVAIEGLGASPAELEKWKAIPIHERLHKWLEDKRGLSGKSHRRYASFDDALIRMKEANTFLSNEQVTHLTQHGVIQNEDGTFSWKFDTYNYQWSPVDLTSEQIHTLWRAINCPTLLCYGNDSWASNPETDGRIKYFSNAEVVDFDNAGHWLHHDQFKKFMQALNAFLEQPSNA